MAGATRQPGMATEGPDPAACRGWGAGVVCAPRPPETSWGMKGLLWDKAVEDETRRHRVPDTEGLFGSKCGACFHSYSQTATFLSDKFAVTHSPGPNHLRNIFSELLTQLDCPDSGKCVITGIAMANSAAPGEGLWPRLPEQWARDGCEASSRPHRTPLPPSPQHWERRGGPRAGRSGALPWGLCCGRGWPVTPSLAPRLLALPLPVLPGPAAASSEPQRLPAPDSGDARASE